MGNVRPWQVVLFVAAVVVLGVSVGWMVLGRERVDLASRIYLIDVPTGDVYWADLSGRRGVAIPAKHPETGERTLMPISRDESGEWAISDRYKGSMERMKVQPADVISAGSLLVAVDVSEAKKYRPPSAD